MDILYCFFSLNIKKTYFVSQGKQNKNEMISDD